MQISFLDRPPANPAKEPADCITVVCPWLAGLRPETGLWISALPIHDVNAFLDGDWPGRAESDHPTRLYYGIFALDRFRSHDHLFSLLHSKGIRHIINLPSVSFFDGRTASTFQSLSLGSEQEVSFMRNAHAAGFNVALCMRRPVIRQLVEPNIFDFILTHDGPRSEFRPEALAEIG